MRKKPHLFVPFILMSALICRLEPAFAATKQIAEDFETSPAPGWFADNDEGAGFDFGKASAHQGQGNAWVGRVPGPHAINSWLDLPKYSLCSVQAWIKLSPAFTDGAMYVRGGDGKVAGAKIKELQLPQIIQLYPTPTEWNLYRFNFNTGTNPNILFSISLNGTDKDAWENIDDVEIVCKTPL